ncbi:MAG: 2Fe-2S iron-sulfur cluster-binding protein [Stenotrophobium sp.]
MWFKAKPRKVVVPRPGGTSKRWQQSSSGLAPRAVRVVDIRHETSNAVTVSLEPEDGRRIVIRAGQYLTHCFNINGTQYKRAFSLSASEGGALACTIKLIPGGVVSRHVSQKLRIGDHYTLIGPSGDFVLDPASTRPLAFLAAGSGITPVISLLETALTQNAERSIRLVYASRSETETIFRDRLDELAQRHPSLKITHVLSQPDTAWSGERGRLNGERAAALLNAVDADVYLCGPVPLMDAVEQTLRARGVNGQRIRRERFFAASQGQAARPTAPQQIEFRVSGKTVTQQPGETILEAGLREHIALPFSCTVGGCGHCKVQILEGDTALNEPNCLSPEERATGYTLACSSYATCRTVINI